MKRLFLDILTTFKWSKQSKNILSSQLPACYSFLTNPNHSASPFFLSFPDDNCRLSDYRRLKTKILDLHDKRYTGSNVHGAHKDNMAARKQLVDMMFKRFDADDDGQIDASELSQVSVFYKSLGLLHSKILKKQPS